MDIFRGENFIDFSDRFTTDEVCKQYLADIKWRDGFKCCRCGHEKHTLKPNFSKVCTKCFHIESPTANTLFHKVKFGLKKAFFIVFEMSATSKGLSSSQIAKRYGITRKTAWLFSHKVRIAMKSSENKPIEGTVHVDEFVIGGKENMKPGRSKDSKKKKIVCAVELTDDEKVKRVYSMRIDDYSSESLKQIFNKHISQNAQIVTDEWTGYKPLTKNYNIVQLPSGNGLNFKQLHHVVHQIKTWLRTTFSWIHTKHTNKYLDEYAYRINRSIFKETIFHNLINRMITTKEVSYKEIIVCK